MSARESPVEAMAERHGRLGHQNAAHLGEVLKNDGPPV